jgi:uncharacterized protein (TIGR04168 family)
MKLACIGDIHGFWDAADTAYFNASRYDGLLLVGDLPRMTGGLREARALSALTKPAWMIPGNHDGCSVVQLMAEIRNWRVPAALTSRRMARRVGALARAMAPVDLAGYALNRLNENTALIRARPHAMGPNRFYYAAYMRRAHAVRDFRQSAQRLKKLVDAAPERIVFMGHNGPAGLGSEPTDPWGCDFSPAFGDFGDPDLAEAIDHATRQGKQVLAVIAGHMHHRHKRGGAERVHAVRQQGTLFVNAASVPRIRQDGARRHHVALTLGDHEAQAVETWVNAEGRIVETQTLGT